MITEESRVPCPADAPACMTQSGRSQTGILVWATKLAILKISSKFPAFCFPAWLFRYTISENTGVIYWIQNCNFLYRIPIKNPYVSDEITLELGQPFELTPNSFVRKECSIIFDELPAFKSWQDLNRIICRQYSERVVL